MLAGMRQQFGGHAVKEAPKYLRATGQHRMQPALPTPRPFARASTIPAPVIALALQARFRSRQDNSFSSRMLAAMRQQFG